ncbi:hypothetical protein EON77_14435, partial [bacterium]
MLVLAPIASTATLTKLPEVRPFPAPHPYAISADGGTVVGGFSPANGFRYDVGARRLSRFSPGGRPVYPNAVANGGRVVAGVARNAIVVVSGAVHDLRPLPGDSASVASAVSVDGLTVVGYSQSENGAFRAVRWKGGKLGLLGKVPGYADMHARAVARGGAVVVGGAYTPGKAVRGFLWTEMMGSRLLSLPKWANESVAETITPDARYAAGSASSRNRTSAVRWTLAKGTVLRLGDLPGADSASALGIDPAGKFAVGYAGEKAVIWDAAGRAIPLQSFLAARGVS